MRAWRDGALSPKVRGRRCQAFRQQRDTLLLFDADNALCGQFVMNLEMLIHISPSREALPLAVARVIVYDKVHDDAQAATFSRS